MNLDIFFCKFEHPTKLSFIHSLLHLVQQKFLPQIGLFFLSVAIVNSLIFQGTFNLQMEKVPSKFSSFFVLFRFNFFKPIQIQFFQANWIFRYQVHRILFSKLFWPPRRERCPVINFFQIPGWRLRIYLIYVITRTFSLYSRESEQLFEKENTYMFKLLLEVPMHLNIWNSSSKNNWDL